MKALYRFYFLAILVIFASANAQAQDPFYAQIFANRLSLSPALAGSQGGAAIVGQYRAQWVDIPGHYRQWGLAYDQSIQRLGKGLNWGININMDRAGEALNMSMFHLHFAKEFNLGGNHRLRTGISGGLQLRTIDYFSLRFPDQIDPRLGVLPPSSPMGREHFTQPDFNLGMAYYNRFFYFIGTLKHAQGDWFEADQVQLIRSNTRLYSVTSGLRIPIIQDLEGLGTLSLNPAIHYQQQGAFDFYMLGLSLATKYVQIMTWWQPNERISGGLGATIGPLQLAYQYDRYMTDLARIGGPSHELTLGFRFGGKEVRERSAMPIPKY